MSEGAARRFRREESGQEVIELPGAHRINGQRDGEREETEVTHDHIVNPVVPPETEEDLQYQTRRQ